MGYTELETLEKHKELWKGVENLIINTKSLNLVFIKQQVLEDMNELDLGSTCYYCAYYHCKDCPLGPGCELYNRCRLALRDGDIVLAAKLARKISTVGNKRIRQIRKKDLT